MGLFLGSGSGDDNTTQITVAVDATKAVDGYKEAEKAQDKFTESSKTTEKTLSKTQQALNGFAQGLGIFAGGAVVGFVTESLGRLSSTIAGLAERGEVFGSLKSSFDTLGGSTQIIDEAIERTQGLITKTEAYTIANKAMVAGLPDVNKNFADIAALGASLGNALNINAKQAVEGLTTAIAKARPRQLEMYGIFVDSKQAIKEYADSHGLAEDGLTKLQEKQALQIASMTAARAKLAELGEATDSVANARVSLRNRFSDVLDIIGAAINENEDLTGSYRDLSNSIASVNWEVFARGISTAISYIVKATSAVLSFVKNGLVFLAKYLATLFELLNQFSQGGLAAISFTKAYDSMNKAIGASTEFTKKNTATTEENKKAKNALLEASKKQHEASQEAAKDLAALSSSKKEDIKETYKMIDVYEFLSKEVLKNELIPELQFFHKGLGEGKINIIEYSEAAELLRDKYIELGLSAEEVDVEIKKLGLSFEQETDKIKKHTRETGRSFEETFSSIDWVGQIQGIVDILNEGGADFKLGKDGDIFGLAEFIKSAPSNERKAQRVVEQIGAAVLNAYVPGLGSALDKFLQDSGYGNKLWEAHKKFDPGGDLSYDLIKGLDFGGLLGDTGWVLSPAKIIEKIFAETPGTTARKAFNRFMDRLISDTDFNLSLSFSPDQKSFDVPRDFFKLIQDEYGNITTLAEQTIRALDIPPEIMQKFEGLGIALGGILDGFDSEFLGQFGQLLAFNFQNPEGLNELQLILQAAGVSAEQLQQKLEEAYLTGGLSAESFLVSLNATRDLLADGIPGAIGDFGLAFSNIMNKSLVDGRHAMDGFADLAHEASEAGINDFEALRKHLETVFPKEQVDIFFNTLTSQGITSFEQLKNISIEGTASLVDALQKNGFKFAETYDGFNESLKETEAQLKSTQSVVENFPDLTEKRIRIYVETQTDEVTDKLIQSGTLPQGLGVAT
jgi:hypothetical protein